MGALVAPIVFCEDIRLSARKEQRTGVSALHWDGMEETMLDAGRRPMGRHFYWLLAVIVAFGARVPASGAAPVPQNGATTTTVADTISMADGTTAQGNLIITWPAFVTASGSAVAGGTANVAVGANGALSVALVPNAGATPAGVYYTVVYQLGPGTARTEYWVVPTTSPANLAAVRTTPGSGVAGQPVSMQYVNSALATKANDSAVVHLSGAETVSGTKTFADAPNVPAPTSTGRLPIKAMWIRQFRMWGPEIICRPRAERCRGRSRCPVPRWHHSRHRRRPMWTRDSQARRI